ncbi:DUF3606 domain-containing protein [Sphingosinicella sp. BN140058]|uniref:DUF3606 domain-containing protein n=1 Tax=Sphingosinicella sp. BN140058 TaxID=1892855 RepID=UPI0010123E21|nr:DUF3606 domain-containing protein [Sphingosinicella sp. BN140058]QAY80370.1 DUF3606 domain-containing protein [Sphingosinicella sp. BN140058]
MADDKSNVGEPDRSRVSGSEPYEVSYFANKHGITTEQARELIEKHGNDRETLDRAAEKLKG